jgi:hypothetical protein
MSKKIELVIYLFFTMTTCCGYVYLTLKGKKISATYVHDDTPFLEYPILAVIPVESHQERERVEKNIQAFNTEYRCIAGSNLDKDVAHIPHLVETFIQEFKSIVST